MIVFPCPLCAAKLGAHEKNAGKSMPCPYCHQQITVPSAAPASAPPLQAAPTLVKTPAQLRDDAAAEDDEDEMPQDDPLAVLAPPREGGELGWLGPYRVLRVLGQGGMGVVFLAEDRALSRQVAIKTLLPSLAVSAAARRRFHREARAAAAVKHDHIVTIHNVGEQGGIPFLVMELLEGQSLNTLLEEHPRLSNAEVLRIGREMAEGLAAAHGRGLIHRDIKPANVWLESRHCDSGRVKLLDFGLARPDNTGQNLTETGVLTGTPSFMAPELALGKPADPRTDLFSLGCVLYRMATGRLPFRGDNGMEILLAVTRNDPQPPRDLNPNLPPRLAALILSLLAKNRHDRPDSARAVAETLAVIERDRDVPFPTPVPHLPSDPDANFKSKTTYTMGRKLNIKETQQQTPVAPPPPAEDTVQEAQTGKRRKRLSRRDFRRRVVIAAIITLVVSITGFELLRHSRKDPPAAPQTRELRTTTLLGPPPAPDLSIGAVQLPPHPSGAKRKPPEYELRVARWGDAALLPGLRDVFGASRLRHWGPIHALAFSRDGKLLASASADHSIKLWDPKTGREIRTYIGHSDPVLAVAFNPDGLSLASASADGTIKLWEVDKSEEAKTLDGHTGPVLSVIYNRDGSALASSGADHTIRIWDPLTGKPETLAELADETRALAYSPDGRTLATGGRGEEVVLWDVAAGKARAPRPGHRGGVTALAFATDGRLAVAQERPAIKVWQPRTGKELRHLPLKETAHNLAFSPDGKVLAVSGRGHAVVLWDPASGKEKSSLPVPPGGVTVLAIAADGLLATAGGEGAITLRQAKTGKVVPGTANTVRLTCAAFSADGKVLAFGGTDGRMQLWERDAPDAEPRILKGPAGTIRTAVFSRNGRLLAWGCDHGIVIWDLAQNRAQRTLTPNRGIVRALAFSPDSRLLAAVLGDDATVWDVAGGTESFTLHRPKSDTDSIKLRAPGVAALAFSSDGKLLATSDRGQTVTLWDAASGEKGKTLVGHLQPVRALAFPESGQTLISADEDGNVRLWDTETGETAGSWRRQKCRVTAIAFLPNSQVGVAACDGTVRSCDPATGEEREILRLGPGGGAIVQAAFSPDGAYLATVNGNGTIYVLRRASRAPR